MTLYVASDLHLDERGQVRLFDDEKQGRAFAGLCETIGDADELVLLGDVFDFTAMTPPKEGLERFFATLDVPYTPAPRRDLPALCAAVRESNPIALEALARLSQRAKVTLVPGNHDRHLGEPGAAEALASIGLRALLQKHVVREIGGRTIVLLHGHELDKSNREPEGAGEVMTNALHHAVIPFLRHHGSRRNVRMDASRVVALRPEENVISVLQRWLDDKTFWKFFRAFLRLLAENGYLPRPASWLASLVSANGVRRRAERADRLWEESGSAAVEMLRGERAMPEHLPQPHALVLGHTHVLDWAVEDGNAPDERLYVNLGTWTRRAFDAFSPPDTTLPVLELCERDQRLHAVLRDLQHGGVLQEFETLQGKAQPSPAR
jgi:UDP-2,3-diacylglucosamine pyrophosphatase LpxH